MNQYWFVWFSLSSLVLLVFFFSFWISFFLQYFGWKKRRWWVWRNSGCEDGWFCWTRLVHSRAEWWWIAATFSSFLACVNHFLGLLVCRWLGSSNPFHWKDIPPLGPAPMTVSTSQRLPAVNGQEAKNVLDHGTTPLIGSHSLAIWLPLGSHSVPIWPLLLEPLAGSTSI